MSDEEFERLVSESIDTIPERFLAKLDNVAIVIAQKPTKTQLHSNGIPEHSTLLGLYEGVPLPARGEFYGGMVIPDKITIFRGPILENTHGDPQAIRELVRSTVWHEIAHYFGYADEQIEEREEKGTNFSQ